MGVNYFTDEQVQELRKNPYVKNCSNKSITYDISFKEFFMKEYNNGNLPSSIFIKAGFKPSVLGKIRIDQFSYSTKKQSERFEGFKDTRKGNSARPKTKDLTIEEENQILKDKISILKQENDFLKRVRFINKKQISKQLKIKRQSKSTN